MLQHTLGGLSHGRRLPTRRRIQYDGIFLVRLVSYTLDIFGTFGTRQPLVVVADNKTVIRENKHFKLGE